MSARPLITCHELIDFIADFFEGMLTAEQSKDFQSHLARCPSCRAYLATYEKTIRMEKVAFRFDDSVNDDVPEELIRVILKVAGRA